MQKIILFTLAAFLLTVAPVSAQKEAKCDLASEKDCGHGKYKKCRWVAEPYNGSYGDRGKCIHKKKSK